MSIIISKETINRLLKDIKQIIKNPLIEQGIYYIHDDTDMLKGYAMIIGPSDTPYFGGFYFFKLIYPPDYPYSPPIVKYYTNHNTNNNTIRFNPNLYTCGKVCVSILNTWRGEQWSSCQTISTILLTLCTLLCKNPLLNEPGITIINPDLNNYNEIIEYCNLDIAVCDIIMRKPVIYIDFFNLFYPYIKEKFNENYNNHIVFVQNKLNENNSISKTIGTNIYNMSVNIDYSKLIIKLNQASIYIKGNILDF
jgi:ubiquitin-conjugating enzyme E2 Z